MFSKCLILWIGYFAASTNAAVVPWIKPCAIADSACIINSANFAVPYFVKGVPELDIPALEPMSVKDDVVESGELKVKYRNLKIHHLSKCKFESFTRDSVNLTVSGTLMCPYVIKGEYSMNGTLFLLHIFGEGDVTTQGGAMLTTTEFKLKPYMKDGKKHYKINSFNYKFEPVSKYTIKFENLYNGDKARAEPVEKIINDAWKEILLDLGQPIMKEGMTIIASAIGKLIKGIPAEELEIE